MGIAVRLIAILAMLTACVEPQPLIDCHLGAQCDDVVNAASTVLPAGASRWVVVVGRSPGGLHAEVHACYRNGTYLLADVFEGERWTASLRDEVWPDPPCR
jgi:hypothetical protein